MKARDRFFVDGVACRLDGHSYRVANLGSGGFFAACDLAPGLGQTLEMELVLPTLRTCRIVGQVSWINGVDEHYDDLPAGFGVRLTRVESDDRDAIDEVLRLSAPVLGPVLPPRLGEP